MKTKKGKNIYIGILVLLISISAYLIINQKIDQNLEINLNGSENIILNYGDKYEELGATAKYDKKDLTDKIKIDSNLNTNILGNYIITYTITYKNKIKEVRRNIKIVDNEAPTIEVTRDKTILVVGNNYSSNKIIIKDNYDNNISDKLEIDKSDLDITKPGEYTINYKVKDSGGNETSVSHKVIVTDKKATKIPVLNYHFFYENGESCNEALCENMDTFRKQLDYLKENNYYTLTIDEFTKWMYGQIELPEKSILITVDDGAFGTSKINGNHLIPTLEQYKMHATLFLITGWWDIENYRSDYLDIQSHTHNLHYEAKCGHRSKVNCVSYEELLDDLKKSIDVVKNTNSFCFPFYDYTENSIKAVKEAGFKIAFIGGKRKATRDDDKYKIPRYPIYKSTSMDKFIEMIS